MSITSYIVLKDFAFHYFIFVTLFILTHWVHEKWLQFCRHFLVHFLELNCCILIKILLKFVFMVAVNKPAFVDVMVWHRTGNKPLCKPIMAQFTDAYMYLSAKMSYTQGVTRFHTNLSAINSLRPRKMAASFLTTFSNAFSWLKML